MFDKRVIFIILIGVIISSVISISLSDNTKDFVKQLFVYKVWNETQYDLIIAGDSRIYRGVSTKPFSELLDVKAINLGFSSGIFEKHMFQLIDEKLNYRSHKKTIVLGISPLTLTMYSWPNGHIQRIKDLKQEDVINYLYFLDFNSYFTPMSISEFRSIF